MPNLLFAVKIYVNLSSSPIKEKFVYRTTLVIVSYAGLLEGDMQGGRDQQSKESNYRCVGFELTSGFVFIDSNFQLSVGGEAYAITYNART